MAWYRTGAVSLTTGSNIVTGTGTDWKKNINGIGQGQALVANKTRVEIMYVDSDTQIRLAEPWSEPAYSGTYHIETAFAGTTGDSARQVMAALFLWKQMGVDWDEWLTSEAATVEVTNVFGEKVTIPTWKALAGASNLMAAVESITETLVTWKGNYSHKFKGGLSVGSSEYSGIELVQHTGRYTRIENTPHGAVNFLTIVKREADGSTISSYSIPAGIGTGATQQWVNKMIYASGGNSVVMKNPAAARVAAIANDAGEVGGFDFQNSRWAFIHNQANFTVWGSVTNLAPGDYGGYKSQRGDGTSVQWQTSPYNSNTYNSESFAFYEQDKPSGATNVNQWKFNREGSVDVATRQWIRSTTGIGGITLRWKNVDLNYIANGSCVFMQGNSPDDNYFSAWGAGLHINYLDSHGFRIFVEGGTGRVMTNVRTSGGAMAWNTLWGTQNTAVDGNGFIKRASPVIHIKHNGYSTNAESRGATVAKLGVGEYEIRGILGYNSDGAWGVSGGVSVPKDNNGLELVYVKDEVLPDGSIVVRTYHRQHSHLPEMFQNNRKKPDGSSYTDGEACDLPVYTRLDIRVQMPENSEYNQRQAAMGRYALWAGILNAMQKALSDKTTYLPAPADI